WLPSWIPSWRELVWGTGWAVAAVFALVWVTRPSFRQTPTPSELQQHITRSDFDPTPAGAVSANPRPFPGASTANPDTLAFRGPAGSPAGDAPFASNDWNLLRQRLRDLGTLNQTLAQQVALPPGSARFQVFRLSPTNGPSYFTNPSAPNALASTRGQSDSATTTAGPQSTVAATLQRLLAQALARELAVAIPVPVPAGSVIFEADPTLDPTPSSGSPSQPSTPSGPSSLTGNPDATPSTPSTASPPNTAETASNPGDNTAINSTGFAIVDLVPPGFTGAAGEEASPPVSFANRNNHQTDAASSFAPTPPSDTADSGTISAPSASALGVYSSETGIGSIALVTPEGPPPGYAYQFWVVNNQALTTFSLGTTTHSGGRMVVNFTLDPNLVFSPGFLVTLEPIGGSAFPTGPVVVAPPVALQPNPSPAPAP
ncbi:MAG: anti-sigma factor, partial [Limisphaerales bacterium]